LATGWSQRGNDNGQGLEPSLSLAAPGFGPRKLYAISAAPLGRDDDSVFAVVWNLDDDW
jgi:hypothetical protein